MAKTGSNDQSTELQQQLSALERGIQDAIQGVATFLKQDFSFIKTTRRELREREAHFRQAMRMLRRWRHGSERFDTSSIAQLARTLATANMDVLGLRIQVISDTLSDIEDATPTCGTEASDSITSQVESVRCELTDVQSKCANLAQSDGPGFDRLNADVKALEGLVLALKTSVPLRSSPNGQLNFCDASETKGVKNNTVSTSGACVSGSNGPTSTTENSPEMSRVIRNAAHIRRMTESLRQGHHVTVEDSPSCAQNDLEVLQRQMRKVQQWQQRVQNFSGSDVDDLELILSAIQRHIESDTDPHMSLKHNGDSVSPRGSPREESQKSEVEAAPGDREVCGVTNKEPPDDGNSDTINERLI